MKSLHITTPYGRHYVVDSERNFIKSENGTFSPDGTWKMLGVERIGPFNTLRFIPFNVFWGMVEEGRVEWKFKNGKPRYTVRDLDHGTMRVWGNWNCHGVRSAWVE